MLFLHTARVKEQRERMQEEFESRQENQIAARMLCDKVDRCEAMRRSLDIMHGNRTRLGEQMQKALEEEREKLETKEFNLERWSAG